METIASIFNWVQHIFMLYYNFSIVHWYLPLGVASIYSFFEVINEKQIVLGDLFLFCIAMLLWPLATLPLIGASIFWFFMGGYDTVLISFKSKKKDDSEHNK